MQVFKYILKSHAQTKMKNVFWKLFSISKLRQTVLVWCSCIKFLTGSSVQTCLHIFNFILILIGNTSGEGINLHSRRTLLEPLLLKVVFLIGLWMYGINYHHRYVRHLTFPVSIRVPGTSCYQDMSESIILYSCTLSQFWW